jgi:uncharacterized membrane protein
VHPKYIVQTLAAFGKDAGIYKLAKPPTGGSPMRTLLLVLGLVALAIGLLWIGQGTGMITWPASSFMIREIQWAGYGAALAGLGLVLIWQSKR